MRTVPDIQIQALRQLADIFKKTTEEDKPAEAPQPPATQTPAPTMTLVQAPTPPVTAPRVKPVTPAPMVVPSKYQRNKVHVIPDNDDSIRIPIHQQAKQLETTPHIIPMEDDM